MAKRNTKELILLEALKLFADKGYEGVSVRDIAAEVGIRQSSLYKHFESKQDIFDTLVETMKNRFPQASASFQLPDGAIQEVAKEYATRGTEFLKKTSAEIFRFYLKDPYASQFRKMLSIEKYRSPEIDRIYREIYMESAISYQAALFEEMMAQGLMRQTDASIMALQFFAPIFLLLNQYDGIPEKEAEALEILGRHIEQFDQIVYGTKYGCTRKCAELLKERLSGEVCLQNAKSYRGSLKEYDAVFIGGSVYMGKIRGEVSHFCRQHSKELLKKRLGLFACCYTPKETEGFLETLFPRELLGHAAYVTAVGGEMHYEKMNVVYRKLFQSLKKIDGFREGFQEPQINLEEIQKLADAVLNKANRER